MPDSRAPPQKSAAAGPRAAALPDVVPTFSANVVYAARVPAWLPFVIAGALLLGLVLAARRATTVLFVRAVAGEVVELRGRAPGELLRDLGDVFARNEATGSLTLRLDSGEVAAETADFDAATAQQIRNVLGRFPAARLKTAPRVRER